MPKRIQRKRVKGWRMPENTKDVTRSSNYGNIFKVGDQILNEHWNQLNSHEQEMFTCRTIHDAAGAVYLFRKFQLPTMNVEKLRGFDLACWCRKGDWCHGDYILLKANFPQCNK